MVNPNRNAEEEILKHIFFRNLNPNPKLGTEVSSLRSGFSFSFSPKNEFFLNILKNLLYISINFGFRDTLISKSKK